MTSPKPAPGSSRNGSLVWIGALVVVVLLGVVAVVIARGGSDETVEGQTGTVITSEDPAAAGGNLPLYDANAAEDPAVGMTIPTVTGTDFAGDEVTISGTDGQAKVIVFVAHWCPHCQREVPLLKEHLDDNPMPDDVELLTVSTSVKPEGENYPPEEWLDGEGWTAPVVADDEAGSIAQAFGLSAFPYFVVVDADGQVVERASGEISTDEFDDAIAAAQA